MGVLKALISKIGGVGLYPHLFLSAVVGRIDYSPGVSVTATGDISDVVNKAAMFEQTLPSNV